jgi:TolB-like protein
MQALVAKHLGEQVPMITTVRPAVPDELEDVIMRALEKVPADRFATLQEFSEALSMVAGTTGTWARRSGRHTQSRLTPIRPTRTSNRIYGQVATPWYRQAAVVAGAAVVLGGGAMGAWMFAAKESSFGVRQMGATASGFQPRRVAIPYFKDVSAAQKYGVLATGLTEGLIDRLMEVQGLDVVSKSAVSAYQNEVVSRDTLARKFQAAWLIEGSVSEDGPDVRVTVKLIDGTSGSDIFTESFTRPAGRALALRDSLVQNVAGMLTRRLGEKIEVNAQRVESNSDDAWLLVQQAEKFRRDGEAAARERELDATRRAFDVADSLLAAAELLDTRWPEPVIQRSMVAYRRGRIAAVAAEKLRWYRQAIAHADRALRNGATPQNAGALEFRGSARFYSVYDHLIVDQRESDSTFAQAVRDLQESTRLWPRSASAWMTLSTAYAHKPDFASSKLAAMEALRSDQFHLSAALILDRLYRTSYITETFNDADQYCGQGRARFPSNPRFFECALWLYTVKDVRPTVTAATMDTVWMLGDSLQHLTPPSRREFVRRTTHIIAGIVLGRLGQADSARRVLDAVMDTPREADPDNDLLYYNAYARLTLGDRKTAIELLKTYLTRNPEHREGWGKDSAWWWRELKNDPEFQRLIATGS